MKTEYKHKLRTGPKKEPRILFSMTLSEAEAIESDIGDLGFPTRPTRAFSRFVKEHVKRFKNEKK